MTEPGMTAAAWSRRLGASHPRETALIDGTRVRSYGELDARSDRLATALVAAGVAPGTGSPRCC